MGVQTTVMIPFCGQSASFQIKPKNLAEALTPRMISPIGDLEAAVQDTLSRPTNQILLREWLKPSDRILVKSGSFGDEWILLKVQDYFDEERSGGLNMRNPERPVSSVLELTSASGFDKVRSFRGFRIDISFLVIF